MALKHLLRFQDLEGKVRYKYMLDNNYFKQIDCEEKACLLGWVASDAGLITEAGFEIAIYKYNTKAIKSLGSLCADMLSYNKENSIDFIIKSRIIASDLCALLKVQPGKKDNTVQLPELEEKFMWCFLRGYFEGNGHISDLNPHCRIISNSNLILEQIKDFTAIPCYINQNEICWNNNNALDFLYKIYQNAKYIMNSKYEHYLKWSLWIPGLNNDETKPEFTVKKTRADAVLPSKAHASDSGYDLTIVEKVKDYDSRTSLYTTGIKVNPGYGWYFDLVARSSIIKTGYIITNGLGIIDRTYQGEIMVALTKINSDAPDLELPNRIAQLIPRPIVHVNFTEVDDFDDTARGAGGFGSTGR